MTKDTLFNPYQLSEPDITTTFYQGNSYDPTLPDAPTYEVVENGVKKTVHTVSKELRDYLDNRKIK